MSPVPERRQPAARLGRLLLIGFAGFVLFAVAKLPAGLLWQWVGPQFPELLLEGVEGSLWQGSAAEVFFRGHPLGGATWRWRPLALAAGEWRNHLTLESSGERIEAELGVNLQTEWVVTDLNVHMPLMRFLGTCTGLKDRLPVALQGLLDLQIDELVYGDRRIERLRGELRLSGTTLASNPVGDLEAALSDLDGGLHADIRSPDRQSSVGLEGSALLSQDGGYEIDLVVANPDALGKELSSIVRVVGSVTENGRWYLHLQGQL